MSYDMGWLKLAGKTIGEGTFGKASWQNSSLGAEFRVPTHFLHDTGSARCSAEFMSFRSSLARTSWPASVSLSRCAVLFMFFSLFFRICLDFLNLHFWIQESEVYGVALMGLVRIHSFRQDPLPDPWEREDCWSCRCRAGCSWGLGYILQAPPFCKDLVKGCSCFIPKIPWYWEMAVGLDLNLIICRNCTELFLNCFGHLAVSWQLEGAYFEAHPAPAHCLTLSVVFINYFRSRTCNDS